MCSIESLRHRILRWWGYMLARPDPVYPCETIGTKAIYKRPSRGCHQRTILPRVKRVIITSSSLWSHISKGSRGKCLKVKLRILKCVEACFHMLQLGMTTVHKRLIAPRYIERIVLRLTPPLLGDASIAELNPSTRFIRSLK